MEKLMWILAFANFFTFCNAALELTGTHDVKGTWKSSLTLPCVYIPSQDFVQETVIWAVERDQSPATIFRRDSAGDHIMLSRYRDRLSVPKYKPGDVSLQIEKLEVPDSGHYTCKVTWRAQDNSLLTKEITTTVKVVKVAVTKPIIKPGNLGFTVLKGARTSLTCSANGSPPIIYRWFKGEPGGKVVHVSNHAVLMFDYLQASDTGKYYCEAENRATTQVIEQSDTVQLTVVDLSKPATTVPNSETKAHTAAMPASEKDVGTTLATEGDMLLPETHEVTTNKGEHVERSKSQDFQRTGLPLYLIILIAVLCVAVVFVVIAVVFYRRKTKDDNTYEVIYRNSKSDVKRQTCSGGNNECNHEEGKSSDKTYCMMESMKENIYEGEHAKENIDYQILVNAMESEYEIGHVQ